MPRLSFIFLILQSIAKRTIPSKKASYNWDGCLNEKPGAKGNLIPIDAVRGAGIPLLVQNIDAALNSHIPFKHYSVKYDDHIEKAANEINKIVEKDYIPKRAVAISLLEEDKVEWEHAKNPRRIRGIIHKFAKEHDLNTEIARERHGQAALIAEKVIYGKWLMK